MKRTITAAVGVFVVGSCAVSPVGKLCQPGDDAFCGEGYTCLTFCDGESGPESICAPAFGAPAGDDFANEAFVDGRVSFGELANVRHMQRSLRIEIADSLGVAFPLLEDVAGDLTIIGSGVECVSFPRLRQVGGLMTVDLNDALSVIEVQGVQSVGGLLVSDNGRLANFVMPQLTIAGAGGVIVEDNALLAEVNLETLTQVDGPLTVVGPALTVIDLDLLVSACPFTVQHVIDDTCEERTVPAADCCLVADDADLIDGEYELGCLDDSALVFGCGGGEGEGEVGEGEGE